MPTNNIISFKPKITRDSDSRQKTIHKDEATLKRLGHSREKVYLKSLQKKDNFRCIVNERSLKLVELASKLNIDKIKRDIKTMTNSTPCVAPKPTKKNKLSSEFSFGMKLFLDKKYKYKRVVRTTTSIRYSLSSLHFLRCNDHKLNEIRSKVSTKSKRT